MNSKILIAFAAGAVIASGIVYVAVRQDAEPKPAAQVAAVAKPAPPPAPVANAPAPAEPVATPAVDTTPAPKPSLQSRVPVREKPSPMPPPRREKPVTIAQNREPQHPTPVPPREPVERQPEPQPQPPSEPQQPAPAPVPEPAPPHAAAVPEKVPPHQPAPEIKVPHTVTITAGTILRVRIGETISAAHYKSGDGFLATLDQPLVVDGFIIAEKGSRLEGRVFEAEPAGRARGTSHLGIELVKLSTSDGQHVQIRTEAYKKEGGSSSGADAAKIGASTAIGTVIGAVAGGGKGAAIGAGAGAAAGVADVMLTRGRPAEIPVETRLTFRIADPLTITERLN